MARRVSEHLAKVPLFHSLTDKQLELVSSLTTLISVRAGTVVVQEGAVGREMMVVVEGDAEVRKGGELVATCGVGDFFGEMALLGDDLRTASVVATSELHLDIIERRDFRALVAANADISRAVTAAADQRRRDLEGGA